MAGIAAHAALYHQYGRMDLHHPPSTYQEGPTLLNARRFTTMPEVLAVAASRSPCVLYTDQPEEWSFVAETAKARDWESSQFRIRSP